MIAIVDGGSDWSVKSMLTLVEMGRVWRDMGLDCLCLTSYCAGLSAFNPIEHYWAPLSRNLSGVILPAIDDGDTVPVPRLSVRDLPREQIKAKLMKVLDAAMNDVVTGYWSGVKFDTWSVESKYISTCAAPFPYSDYSEVQSFFKSTKKVMQSDAMSKYLEELEFILQHCDKRRNELIFMKCTSADCAHCLTHPVQNVAAMDFLLPWIIHVYILFIYLFSRLDYYAWYHSADCAWRRASHYTCIINSCIYMYQKK